MSEGHTERLEAALDGKYKIERKLGEGGMASVYLAEDIKHKRKVALKILKPELAAVIGAERFLTEIQTTANLQHPHILALFDSGNAGGYLYYVMPYIEGETLRQKLDREKQLGVEESVRIAGEVADALDYAHRHGVIHRDIKPGNILLHDGRPVVADFGIALAVSAAGGGRMTETGLSLGTPHYMSPEQASADRDLSARSDIYSLGCVLYEMIGGQPPHTGPSAQSILVHILTEEARPLTKLRHTVPPHVAATVAKAIEKLPADRFETAKSFMEALGDEGFSYQAQPRAVATAPEPFAAPTLTRSWSRLSLGFATTTVLFVALAAWGWLRAEAPQPVSRQILSTEGWTDLGIEFGRSVAIAPDGSSMILPVGGQLGLKMRGSTEITPINETDGAVEVVYSPDAEWIAYSVGVELFKRPVVGGSAVRLAEDLPATSGILGLAWLDDGTILYEQDTPGSRRLVRISEDGGEPLEAILGVEETLRISWVEGLPGARGALVVDCPGVTTCLADQTRLLIVNLEDLSTEMVSEQVLRAWYAPTGHLVYTRRDGAVFAQPFDLSALETTGPAVPLFAAVRSTTRSNSTSADMWLGADGTLLYVEGNSTASGGQRLVVVDLEGNQQVLPLAPRPMANVGLGWSPDGVSAVFASEGHIYTYNVVLNTAPRQITVEGVNSRPVFSPDGTRVAFSSQREGVDQTDLFLKDLNDDSPPTVITLEAAQYATQWPADTLIVFERGQSGNRDLWMVDISDMENPEARPYLTSEADLERISVSPDGRLAAYRSNESGADEIYVRSFPNPGERTIVSRGGGLVPFWSPDGNTLYYATGSGRPFVAARLQRDPVPVVLSTDTLFSIVGLEPFPGSALHPDGDRFILASGAVGEVATPEGDASRPDRLILVQSFFEELRERMGR